MPSPMLINLKHEAEDLGVDFNVDLYSGLPPPERPATARRDADSDDDSESETTMITPPPADTSKSGIVPPSCITSFAAYRHHCFPRA